MPKYNIIYTSPDNDPYLWSDTSLDKLEKTDREVLRFSGKVFEKDELADAIAACKKAAKKLFTMDDELKVDAVEVKVV
jgi:hypothetical protein